MLLSLHLSLLMQCDKVSRVGGQESIIGKYLSRIRKCDQVIALQEGFEA